MMMRQVRFRCREASLMRREETNSAGDRLCRFGTDATGSSLRLKAAQMRCTHQAGAADMSAVHLVRQVGQR